MKNAKPAPNVMQEVMPELKVAVVSKSGGIGKTTLSTHVLHAKMPRATFFSMEDINRGAESFGVDITKIDSDGFQKMLNNMFLEDACIIDVGASNIRYFLDGLKIYRGSCDEIDYFVVPLTSESRYQEEAIQTILALRSLGVPDSRIRPIFNMVKESRYDQDEFRLFLNFLKSDTTITMHKDCVLFDNPGIETMSRKGLTITKVLEDPRDYKADARALRDEAQSQRERTQA
ncbi:hypothetical protein [Aeromonas caviae]|uniref:ParA family protein n=1 Tax=Aeromonas caviae TaxID=648 RepID=A0AAJ6CTU9_AERCA|nr:hypothetical protein [Aeromonas caviae]WFG00236.1 hypothetical protein P5S46_22335 [Aeromonas caviae]